MNVGEREGGWEQCSRLEDMGMGWWESVDCFFLFCFVNVKVCTETVSKICARKKESYNFFFIISYLAQEHLFIYSCYLLHSSLVILTLYYFRGCQWQIFYFFFFASTMQYIPLIIQICSLWKHTLLWNIWLTLETTRAVFIKKNTHTVPLCSLSTTFLKWFNVTTWINWGRLIMCFDRKPLNCLSPEKNAVQHQNENNSGMAGSQF